MEWSALALADRAAIFDHIAAENPRAAVALDQQLAGRIAALPEFPRRGRPGRVEATRELPLPPTPYIAVYQLRGDTLRILRLLHGARLWPDERS
nr:type II toxin-antitoxin system RelE/ParE family toxin [Roseomonas marmotae]